MPAPRPSTDVTDHNARIFFDPKLAAFYANHGLHPGEAAFQQRHADAYRGKRMLDLGVGSGRTTRFFMPATSAYVGIDIAAPMLEAARRAFPGATFLAMDLRAIGTLDRGSFDVVLGAWAILSAFTHGERLQILADIHDLLSDGGVFYFSAHNREWSGAGKTPLHIRSWHPRRFAGALNPLNWYNFLRLRHLRREAADHAIFNDLAHHWRGVFYYIDRASQQRQLEAAGFALIESYGGDGRVLTQGEDVSQDGLLHYVCRKVP